MTEAPEPPKFDYRGMTTNERLFAAGVLDQFDDAVRSGDREKMIELLVMVQIDQESAARTADTVLSHPTWYGRTNPTP